MAGEVLLFHRQTGHTSLSVRSAGGRGLDWANEPYPFKEYRDLPEVPLPKPSGDSATPAITALRSGRKCGVPGALTGAGLAHLLYYSAGVTRVRSLGPGRSFHFRAYACAGALYPVEVYVAAADLDGLAAGLYHFHPGKFALRLLRVGDPRPFLQAAAASDPAITEAPATAVLTGLYWRTTWKYRARGYRHLYWDGGMILANLLALAAGVNLERRLVLGFVDAEVDHLLGLDGHEEVSLVLVPLGKGRPVEASTASLPALRPAVAPLSPQQIDYPAIHSAHDASRLRSATEVEAWRAGRWTKEHDAFSSAGAGLPLEPLPSPPDDSLERVILRRGSTRRFTRGAIRGDALAAIVEAALAAAIPTDTAVQGMLNDVFLIVNAVEGLAAGAYVLEQSERVLHRLRTGNFRAEAGYLCLEQPLAADAAAVVFLMADLARITTALGDRGYRAAQLEAGILAGRMYLAAYAQRLGATGLTFYDGDVTRFFSPAAAGKFPTLVVALGRDALRFQDRASPNSARVSIRQTT